ncbi:MAG: hypothetical protein Ct9H300mP1_19320 [Planctomycetaceae bacterium]|nr:MAG: hypothetical protein Ct9H300mP1_19320 [Planctomycetaceae bacterium]
MTALAGAGVFAGALMIEPNFLQPLVIHYVGGSASALFWPGLATLFWRRATARGVTAGLAGGGVVYVAAIFVFKPLFDPVVPLHAFVYGFARVWPRWSPSLACAHGDRTKNNWRRTSDGARGWGELLASTAGTVSTSSTLWGWPLGASPVTFLAFFIPHGRRSGLHDG